MCGSETVIAFAGAKWVFLAWFSVALVMVVSRWSASVVAEVSLVSTSSRHSCLCAKKFALLGPMVGASAKKFALRAKNGQKLAVYGVLGELFRGRADGWVVRGEFFRDNTAGCGVLGEFFRGLSGGVGVPGEFCRTYRHAVSFSGTFGALVTGCARSYPLRNGLQAGVGGGFALHEALWLRVIGVSDPRVVQIPPIGCGEAVA